METSFPDAIAFVLHEEGGYVNNPHDPGGETNFGISKRSYPGLDISALTQEDAIAIYHRDYWIPVGGPSRPSPLDACLLDTAVNLGVGHALSMLVALGEDASPEQYIEAREHFYKQLVLRKPQEAEFLRIWLGRCHRLRVYAATHTAA